MNWKETYRPLKGYISNIPPDSDALTDYIAKGSQNITILGPGVVESFKGFSDPGVVARGTLNWAFGDTVLSLGDNPSTNIGSGNALLSVGKTIFLVGAGNLRVNGSTIAGVTATSNLKLVLESGGTYSSSNMYQAGLAAPSAPTLSPSGAGGKNTGTYTLVYTKVRTNTGAESKPSPPSNVATATQQLLTGTFPLFGTWTDGTNAYNLYFTPANFGVKGPWLFLKQITASDLDGSGNHTVEFTDAELSPDEPPIDFGIAPAGTHVWQMGNVMIVGGTFGGFGITSSVPNFFEAYSATSTYFLPEALVGTAGGPQDGFTLLICKGSTHAAVWTGAPDGPTIIARPLWKNIGFSTVKAVTIAGKDIYGFTEQQGIVRTGPNGEPDFEFARRVAPDTVSWTPANVVVNYAPLENVVYFIHQNVMLVYHIDLDVWDSPLLVSSVYGIPNVGVDVITHAYTKNNKAYFVYSSSGAYIDRIRNTTDGNSAWLLRTPWLKGGIGPLYKNIERALVDYKTTGTARPIDILVLRNYNESIITASKTITPASTSFELSRWLKFNVRNAKTYQIVFSQSGSLITPNSQVAQINSIFLSGSYDEILQG